MTNDFNNNKKLCTSCNTNKFLDEFYRQPRNKDGMYKKCKKCTIKDQLVYNNSHKEQISAYQRKWYVRSISKTIDVGLPKGNA